MPITQGRITERYGLGVVALAAVAIGVAGCAASPQMAYWNSRTLQAPVAVGDAMASAPVETVAIAEDRTLRISRDSGVLIDEGIRAAYQKVAVDLAADKALRISVRSFCDCFGLRKFVMLPVLRLSDSTGRRIEVHNEPVTWRDPDMLHSGSVIRVWQSERLPAGRYTILIYPDNVDVGRPFTVSVKEPADCRWPPVPVFALLDLVDIASGDCIPYQMVPLRLSTYPYGKLTLRVE